MVDIITMPSNRLKHVSYLPLVFLYLLLGFLLSSLLLFIFSIIPLPPLKRRVLPWPTITMRAFLIAVLSRRLRNQLPCQPTLWACIIEWARKLVKVALVSYTKVLFLLWRFSTTWKAILTRASLRYQSAQQSVRGHQVWSSQVWSPSVERRIPNIQNPIRFT